MTHPNLLVGAALFCLAANSFAGTPAVTAGYAHSIAVSASGEVLAWGSDSEGQLGLDRLIQRSIPAPIAGLPPMWRLERGTAHYIGISRDGRAYTWGRGTEGQLGDGTRSDSSLPVVVTGLTGVTAVAGGSTHSVAATADGSVWSWGSGSGNPGDSALPTRVTGLADVVAVAAGYDDGGFNLALKRDGTVWAWGSNNHGQLGDGTTASRTAPARLPLLKDIVAISVGSGFAAALDKDGSVWAWGRNDLAQMGDNTKVDRLVPSRIPGLAGVSAIASDSATMVAIRGDGSLWMWGAVDVAPGGSWVVQSAPTPVAGVPPVASAAVWTGPIHLALTRDGGVIHFWSRGWAPAWPTELSGAIQVTTGPLNGGAVVKQDGSVWNWGSNEFGQLGGGGVNKRSVPTPVNGLSSVVSVAAGYAHSLALGVDGAVYSWGRNSCGELGDGSQWPRSKPVRVDGLPSIASIAAGKSQSFAIDRNGRLWGWGENRQGQLGDGSAGSGCQLTPKLVSGLPPLAAVAAGDTHTVALGRDGRVWAWGNNSRGQLGIGPVAESRVPTLVPGLTDVKAIAACYAFTILALKADGSIWMWGDDRNFGNGAGDPLPTPTKISVIPGAQSLSLSLWSDSVFVVSSGGQVFAWGGNARGQLGNGSFGHQSVPAAIPGLTGVSVLAAGSYSPLALKSDGSLLAWGGNEDGQLGDGTFATSAVPGLVTSPGADRPLDLDPGRAKDARTWLTAFFVTATKGGGDLAATLTDLRATGVQGEVYFSALVPSTSPLVGVVQLNSASGRAGALAGKRGGALPQASAPAATVPLALGRGGFKQTGPASAATSAFAGALTSGTQFAAYSGVAGDPLADSNAIVCMGVTTKELSAKGQVLIRPIANAGSLSGVTQCPTVQTPATLQLYRGIASGGIANLTLTATITPQPEDRGKVRQVYMWAVTPDGVQYMQTGDYRWELMREPMVPAATITVPASGDITVVAVRGLDLSRHSGTLVYVGMGLSWTDVKQFNKAGHVYTVQ